MATAMTRAQRLATIADSVMEAGALTVHELADRFRVSRMTIYRDLAELEAAGSVWLEQGKATALPSPTSSKPLRKTCGASSPTSADRTSPTTSPRKPTSAS